MSKVQISRLYSLVNWFCIVWAFAILAPLIYFPAPGVLAGHPWKVELTLSLLLVIAAVYFTFFKQNEFFNFSFDRKIFLWIIAPLGVFVFWSGLSALWADSLESVIHHTLVWAVYLTFFLFAAKITTNRKHLKIALTAFSLVICIIAAQCVVEHTFSPQINEVFGFRFARYAEIHAAVLPLFLSFVLRFNKKHLLWAAALSCLVWLAILFSISRGAFLSAIAGVTVFTVFRLLTKTSFAEKKRLGLAVAGLILISFTVQFLTLSADGEKQTTLDRLTNQSVQDDSNGLSRNIRLLYGQVGLKMFADNAVTGVGADNFGLEFNKYRALFSADEKNKSIAGQQEERMPERAHNEYLQILVELGIPGCAVFLLFVFGIGKLAFSEIKREKANRNSILTHAAIAGMTTFLISSLFSSYSFRLMQNGMVFFFLLALLLRNYFSNVPKPSKQFAPSPRLKKVLSAVAVCLCFGLFTLSTLKAASQYFVYRAEREPNLSLAKNDFNTAERLDPANASANYSYGVRLMLEGEYDQAAVNLRKSIDKGLNTTFFYSLLTSSQIMAGDTRAAENTLAEAEKIYPFSTFVQTRYALILKTNGENEQAEKHFLIAKQLNPTQAETWRIFLTDGAAAANLHAISDKTFPDIDNLYPQQSVTAVMTEREILHPEEFVRMKFPE